MLEGKRRTEKLKKSVHRLEEQLELQNAVEDELSRSVDLYRFIVENSHIGVAVIDDNYTVVYGNNELVNILGYTLDEIIGSDFREFIADEHEKDVAERYLLRQEGTIFPHRYEISTARKDGTKRTVEISAALTRSIAGRVFTVVQVFDITERKTIEAELETSREKYRTILENIEDNYFEIDLAGNLVFFNHALVKNLGYTHEETLGMHYSRFIAPDDCDKAARQFAAICSSGKTGKGLHCKAITKNGTLMHIETVCSLMKDEKGNPTGFRGIARDITKRKLAEAALRESEQRFREIIKGTPIPTFVINTDRLVTHWNEACEKLTGIKAEDVIGTGGYWKPFYRQKRPVLADLILDNASPSQLREHYGDNSRSSKIVEGAYEAEAFFSHLGSGQRWLFLTAAPLKDSAGNITGAIETILDMTEKKRAGNRLLKMHGALEKKVKEHTLGLDEANVALKVLLKKREDDRIDFGEQMVVNIRETIFPYIERMKKTSSEKDQEALIEVIERNLQDIASPFMRDLSKTLHKLTPSEIQIINLIRHNKKTKEIAEFLNVSTRTVETHRDNIRKKLGIKRQKTNLKSYLLSIESDGA